jgi:hypothetical protein
LLIVAHKDCLACILEIVVDRPNLGHYRPLCSMGHYNNLLDRTRTVAGVKALNTDIKVYSPYRARMSEIKGMNSTSFLGSDSNVARLRGKNISTVKAPRYSKGQNK